MARHDDAGWLLLLGQDPVTVAEHMAVTLDTVLGYLDRQVGLGKLRRSDIYFSISAERRRQPPTPEYELIIKRYRNGAAAFGDMYDDLREIEIGIHGRIQRDLVDHFGSAEDEWWRKGVPERIRVKCAGRREEDRTEVCDPYGYTDLLDMSEIIKHAWRFLEPGLPEEIRGDRPALLSDLRKLNRIRNGVMHPVRGKTPSEDHFEFVRRLKRDLSAWIDA